jgi:hypothetical protein
MKCVAMKTRRGAKSFNEMQVPLAEVERVFPNALFGSAVNQAQAEMLNALGTTRST